MYHDITRHTVAQSESHLRIATNIQYIALTGEIWGTYCDGLGEKWPCYNGTVEYFIFLNSAGAGVVPWNNHGEQCWQTNRLLIWIIFNPSMDK